ncbi:MAG: TlpA family protein disulfide reductase [Syntrophobacteraceae bacterium]
MRHDAPPPIDGVDFLQKARLALVVAVICLIGLLVWPRTGEAVDLPEKGKPLPDFSLQAPAIDKDREYLGLKVGAFKLKEIPAELLIVEIIGVYCPLCHQQAPLFNKLVERIEKKNLTGKVKLLAVAAGGNPIEIDHLRTNSVYEYPIVPDESFAVHKLLGQPRTPFTLILDKGGKVLDAHLGVLEDMDAYFEKIQGFLN